MSIVFPSFVPSQREFTLNNYPVKIYRTLSGAVAKRSFGNKPYSYRLDLEFTNVTDDVTFGILDHYEQTSAGFFRFSLPSSLFNGISDPLAGRMRSPSHILWEYESPPVLQSIHTGITTVSVRLIGDLDVDAPAGGDGGGGNGDPDLSQYEWWRVTVSFTDCFQTGPFTYASRIDADTFYATWGVEGLIEPTGAGDWVVNKSLVEVVDFAGGTGAFNISYREIASNQTTLGLISILADSVEGQILNPTMTGTIRLYSTTAAYDNDIPDFIWNGFS